MKVSIAEIERERYGCAISKVSQRERERSKEAVRESKLEER